MPRPKGSKNAVRTKKANIDYILSQVLLPEGFGQAATDKFSRSEVCCFQS